MSEHSISIVPKQSSYPNKEEKAREVLDWLISLDCVKPEKSDCVLSREEGYAVSDGARNVTNKPDYLPFGLITNGLEITTERQVFLTGENGINELICPSCNKDISGEDWDFLNDWSKSKSDNIICPLCNVGKEIHSYNFSPAWGFSDLGFTFWNWPELKESFIRDFKNRLLCDINIVYTWL